jgi:catechol 2,3-dioxygenase-like lactoylglutathione lyase family enzyme
MDQNRYFKRGDEKVMSPFHAIRAIDYTVILVRDMEAMRQFYEDVLGFLFIRELSENWREYRVGSNTLVLARPRRLADEPATPKGSASVQLAFRVPPPDVDRCADWLARRKIATLSPPTNHAFGHRTLFFRDPDGNLIEIYAEI